ncbi:MAG: phosphopentomutase [Planctomycetes bacterium]|nr:phosphopentomutase [Planctomycetota bacterium]HPF14170.1 phosphopentomutase [Planctomycetota bacterium]HRV81580.1 phosphopentomutase [Planctomycetota bacterium]
MKRRVFVLVLDSLGVGALPDADRFGEQGCHTLNHLAEAAGGLQVPRLEAWGLGNIEGVTAVRPASRPLAAFGRMAEVSPGKDTPTGHWEMMGCPLDFAFPVYEEGFPDEIMQAFVERTGVPGYLCNRSYSGTEVIEDFGEEHRKTGKPIVYTSADSVFQIAAHEEHFGLERLYEVCKITRELLDPYKIGRVIARPFVGEPGSYRRTYHRHDYGIEPPSETVLDRLMAAGVPTLGLGKIQDLFCGRGISEAILTQGNDDGMAKTRQLAREVEHGLIFNNLVDFDSLYGHRRDAIGYRRALEQFDAQFAVLETMLRKHDLVFLTADHGNDPTYTQTSDHTREYVPVLVGGPGLPAALDLGTRSSFADLGATVAAAFGLPPQGPGLAFW